MSEVGELISSETRAWNAGDATAFSERVTDDCVFTNISGSVFVGRDAFEAQHARIFAGIYRGSNLEQKIDHLRLIRPDVAIVDTSVTLRVQASDFGPGRMLETKLLQVLTRDEGKWRIAAYHNVAVRPLPDHTSKR